MKRPWRVEVKDSQPDGWRIVSSYKSKLVAEARALTLLGQETRVVKHVEFEAKE